jgi:hypothetical protein
MNLFDDDFGQSEFYSRMYGLFSSPNYLMDNALKYFHKGTIEWLLNNYVCGSFQKILISLYPITQFRAKSYPSLSWSGILYPRMDRNQALGTVRSQFSTINP